MGVNEMDEPVAIGPLGVRQGTIQFGWKPARKYDLFISALSWETRGTSFVQGFGNELPPVSILRFASSDPKIGALKEAKLAAIRACCQIAGFIDLQISTSLQENYKIIETVLRDRASE